jgi:hypothetical protein
MKLAVSELEQNFGGKIVTQHVDATTPDSRPIVQALGFKNHGLVIRSPQGETLWKQPDHQVLIEDVKAALRDLTARE